MRTRLDEFTFGETKLVFDVDNETKNVGMNVQHSKKTTNIYETLPITSLFQVKKIGDKYPKGFSNGRTMINSESSANVKFVEQLFNDEESRMTVTTIAADENGNEYRNIVEYDVKYDVIETWNEFECKNENGEKIEFFPSVTIEGISPYTNDSELVELTKYRSQWTMEGKRDVQTFANLQLEQCWKPSGVSVEKFGYTGSMPVNGFFPITSICDTSENVAWSYQLHAKSSWQIEVYNKEMKSSISLGLPDRSFGDVLHILKLGDKIITPKVRMAVTNGSVEDSNRKLTRFQEKAYSKVSDNTMPIIFNEFCSSWGSPDQSNIISRGSVASEMGCDYFVIDAGWYNDPQENSDLTIGDWAVDQTKFPNGLKPIKEELKKLDMKLGIWFEYENCGSQSAIYNDESKMLYRDGLVLETVKRRFLDFRKKEVIEYIDNHVDKLIKEEGIDYVKIDYNDSMGYGIDHEESSGLGVIEAVDANYSYFDSLVKKNPNVIFESCSSGGHRLTLPFVEATNMSSFSDAHETNGIPLVAANLSTLFLLKQMQIWAVLNAEYSNQKLAYLLTSTFVGRMCISGLVEDLSSEQISLVKRYVDFYKGLEEIIMDCECFVRRSHEGSYSNPKGYQVVEVKKYKSDLAYLVIQSFELERETKSIDLSGYEIIESISHDMRTINSNIQLNEDYDSVVIKVRKV